MDNTLMTHMVAGYPDFEKSVNVAKTMVKCGVGFLEIQIPFSDPVADGPVIMEACETALNGGLKVSDCFDLMKEVVRFRDFGEEGIMFHKDVEVYLEGLMDGVKKKRTEVLFMTYFNVIFKYGVRDFCKKAKESGAYGLIVPDMPIDEEDYEGFFAACKEFELKAILVVSALTTEERLAKVGKMAEGLVYCVAKYGVTGSNFGGVEDFEEYLQKVRKYVDLPLAVGFGIKKKEHVQAVHAHAPVAVIGSALVERV